MLSLRKLFIIYLTETSTFGFCMEWIPRHKETTDWVFYLFIAAMLVLLFVKAVYGQRFKEFLMLPYNNKFILLHANEDGLRQPFLLIFMLIRIFAVTLFLFFGFSFFDIHFTFIGIEFSIWSVLFVIAVFVLVKFLLQRLVAWMFSIQKVISGYVYRRISYASFASLILLIGTLIMFYSDVSKNFVFYSTLGLVVVINAIGVVEILRNYQKLIFNNLFYFILYLCAFEIAPYLIVGAIAKIQG